MNATKLKKILAALPETEVGVVRATGLGRSLVHRYFSEMRRDKLIHIGSWRASPGKGPAASVLHSGEGVDVKVEYNSKKQVQDRLSRRIAAEKTAQRNPPMLAPRGIAETTVQRAMRTQPASVFSLAYHA